MTNDSDDLKFELTRTFDVAPEQLWQAFTEARHLENWWGPTGGCEVKEIDVRPGGRFHYCQTTPQGEMWGLFVYRDVDRPNRMDYVSSFSDSEGNVARAPFSDLYPLEIMNEARFVAEDGGARTRWEMRAWPHEASPEEEDFFRNMRTGMRGGYGAVLDGLAEYLNGLKG